MHARLSQVGAQTKTSARSARSIVLYFRSQNGW